MPYAVTISAYAHGPTIHSINGSQLQGAFLDVVRRADRVLSAELHTGDALRPYALSLLFPRLGQERHKPITQITLRVACLDDRIYPVLLQMALEPAWKAILRIGATEFSLARLDTTSEPHPAWVGFATVEDLLRRAEQAAATTNLIELEFVTPTVFAQGERGDVPFPMPEFVFGGLARRWNSMPDAPFQVSASFQEDVEKYVALAHFQGETSTVNIGDNLKKTGFVGRVAFRIRKPELALTCHLLAETAFFTGLGAKTSRGLGCVRKM